MAAKKDIPLRLHRVIYKLIDELKEDLSSKLSPTTEENIIGEFNFNITHVDFKLFVLLNPCAVLKINYII